MIVCVCVWLYQFHLGLSEGQFVRDDVVFVVEGVKQEELIPLRAATHQSTGLSRRHKKGNRGLKQKTIGCMCIMYYDIIFIIIMKYTKNLSIICNLT